MSSLPTCRAMLLTLWPNANPLMFFLLRKLMSVNNTLSNVMTSFRVLPKGPFVILIPAVLLRVGLIVYSEWHDRHSVVKYTDIDYRVFTDAARYIVTPGEDNIAQGSARKFVSFAIGNPYLRDTYRYTPLLAALLAPNILLLSSFGKYLFAACDIINGLLIYRMLISHILPWTATRSNEKTSPESKALILTAFHLFNPLIFSISTRGSSESVLSLFVLGTLSAALSEHWDTAAILLGISTHWKVYPAIYGVSCIRAIGSRKTTLLSSLVNQRTIRFFLLSLGTFALLNAFCYLIWGDTFLQESYFYHLHRRDHRHNFSPYFYLIYLTYPGLSTVSHFGTAGKLAGSLLLSFVPQMGLVLAVGLLFGRRRQDLVFAWFTQTFVFVALNKVCTSQYFLWYIIFLPLLIPSVSMTRRTAISLGSIWVVSQASWLWSAYQLEFLGKNTFLLLWIKGLVFLAANCALLAGLVDAYDLHEKSTAASRG